jgi:gliding motility-associated lipoprotein GldH
MFSKHFVRLVFGFLVLVILASCDNGRVYEENKELPDNVWNVDNVVKLEVDITDTAAPTNFYINVRNAEGYPYSNIYLFIKTRFPNGQESNDTLKCVLADEKGQ